MKSFDSGAGASRFYDRLRNAGIEPDDSEEIRLNKSLLMLATGLVSVAIMIWVTIYSILGPQFSATIPFSFQLLLAGNMLLYIKTRNFEFFRVTQLGLFLFLGQRRGLAVAEVAREQQLGRRDELAADRRGGGEAELQPQREFAHLRRAGGGDDALAAFVAQRLQHHLRLGRLVEHVDVAANRLDEPMRERVLP